MSIKYFLFAIFLSIGFDIVANDVKDHELSIVLRQIGHRVLLSSGDSTSRVLPVKDDGKKSFTISFENPLFITSDSLYHIVQFELNRINIREYVAELKDCQSEDVYLSFLYSKSQDSITPCGGRDLPIGCYKLEIKILKNKNYFRHLMLLVFVFIIAVGLYFFYKMKANSPINPVHDDFHIPLGSYKFDVQNRRLLHSEENENLTEKECNLLSFLLKNLNETVSREVLMKEIWSENGIIVVSKNLDVLVSKLRKKFRYDENVKITSIHGVGYKLEIDDEIIP